ncbi:uncharacterized protein LOC123684147 [Harmonia axyridis]|uniref:uncharacterized protein LOC123684147 n=1 Tax=Harmonia axyridis TaxID=115357 RepID=UPI001E2760BE|nr:uncharacterized protein LOC123684147 [Harmonia axyridis]
MTEIFTKIIERIFSNWTALQLAVQHSHGGPNSLQIANEIKTYMVEYCLQNKVEAEDIRDALEEIMDEEFDTICDDNSTKEISIIIHRFLQLLKQNDLQTCEIEFNKLPEAQEQWLGMCQSQPAAVPAEESDSSSDDNNTEDTPMEEDSEWTVVKSRKKR